MFQNLLGISDVQNQLAQIQGQLTTLTILVQNLQKGDILMAGTLADALAKLQADVTAQTTVVGGVSTMLSSLSAQLKAALAANDPTQALAIANAIEQNTASLSAAVEANTVSPPPASGAPVGP